MYTGAAAGAGHQPVEGVECRSHHAVVGSYQLLPHSDCPLVPAPTGLGLCRHCLDRGNALCSPCHPCFTSYFTPYIHLNSKVVACCLTLTLLPLLHHWLLAASNSPAPYCKTGRCSGVQLNTFCVHIPCSMICCGHSQFTLSLCNHHLDTAAVLQRLRAADVMW